ncbi:RND transporter [Photorhabdus luminescens]|uniref:efflux RND transporter periplasmic adaptor subunit n=1 Tax=Photorhabdus luminescens TaxID=29488 RepID=UPI000B4C8D56|nr:efflux RND transporter periplasmic adaptor subunit [Photorhabdus luminescens]OWO80208.1 RND transporter [Photorhabdus luminescens]
MHLTTKIGAFARFRRKTLWFTAFIIALIAGAITYLSFPYSTETSSSQRWVHVEPQLQENRLGLVGRIQAATSLTIATPFDGVIAEVIVTEGQRVKRGQPLLSLDTTQLDIQLRQALTELLKAQKTVQDLVGWENSQDVARVRRTLTNAQLSLSDTERKLIDTRALFERGIVPRMEVDTLEQQVKVQQLDLAAAKMELSIALDKGIGENRQIADMELANAQSRYQALQAQQAQRELISPFDGIVIRPQVPESDKGLFIQKGTRVTQGTPLLGVINLEQIQAVARIEETDLHQVYEGMPVEITGDGFAGLSLRGQIKTIGVQGNSKEMQGAGVTYDLLVAIDPLTPEQRQRIRLNMSAKLAIVTYRNERGLAVPAEALRTGPDGRTFVNYRRELNAQIQQIMVTPGHAVPQGVEVSGLEAGYVEVLVQK